MKKLITPFIALALAVVCTVGAFAMEVPTETAVRNLDGVQQYIKVYTVPPDFDPQTLIEEPFNYEGYTYSFSGITKSVNRVTDTKCRTELVTVETEDDDLGAVLAALPLVYEYDDGVYRGTLRLDHASIRTEAAGYVTRSYTVCAVREIWDLDTNDMAYVPPTTMKDGVCLPLQSVDWQVQATALVDDILVPSAYKAVATYSGTAYYDAATGYIATAEYVGEVTRDETESVTYTLTYVGKAICPEEEEPVCPEEESDPCALEELKNSIEENKLLYIVGALLLIALIAGLAHLLRQRGERSRTTDAEYEETEESDNEK